MASIVSDIFQGMASNQTTKTPNNLDNSINQNFVPGLMSQAGSLQGSMAALSPLANALNQQTNSSYAGAIPTLTRTMSQRGYGSSGNLGDAIYQTNLARLGALNQNNGTIANLASSRQSTAQQILAQMYGANLGQNMSTPGAPIANAFSGLASLGGSAAMLAAMLGG